MFVSLCVTGQVTHERRGPAFLSAVLNPHGIDIISGLVVSRLSHVQFYTVCVCACRGVGCVCVEMKAHVLRTFGECSLWSVCITLSFKAVSF